MCGSPNSRWCHASHICCAKRQHLPSRRMSQSRDESVRHGQLGTVSCRLCQALRFGKWPKHPIISRTGLTTVVGIAFRRGNITTNDCSWKHFTLIRSFHCLTANSLSYSIDIANSSLNASDLSLTTLAATWALRYKCIGRRANGWRREKGVIF